LIKTMVQKDIKIKGAEILILGITFKENCPDVRNTKVVDVIAALKDYGVNITIYDPWANKEEVQREYGLYSQKEMPQHEYDSILLAVAHNEFKEIDLSTFKNKNSVVYDVKNVLEDELIDARL
jgi:UDP-N-acetyl-D-glucosamine/UDP-N-acetyl-D-galactosamine dehydrogenase